MTLQDYISNINQRFKLGNATEHTFRGDLQQLIESLVPTVRATNEPKRQHCGAPDYIITKKDIPLGFIEAKDIGDIDLDGKKKNKEQFDRYKASLNNLIFTDYINFHLYRDGQFVTKISIGEISSSFGSGSEGRGGIKPLPENFENFEKLLKDFCTHIGQTIKSSKKLAEMMAGKARMLSDVIEKALTSDEENQEDSTLKDQMHAFKEILIHDITPKGFADVYAQTIVYGMFAARYHDPTLPTFSRQEAYELIPKSNPFLKKLFGYIAGLDVDDRIKWIVDDLVNIFLACNVEEMLKNYGKNTKMEDPIIHFYEDFLSEYDPKLRKARGVWYTPAPVVNFIVRAVDDILKSEFDMPQGLADTSKTKIKVNQLGKQVEKEVHKVQILDPATGTGTFLAEVIKLIHKKFEGQQGIWSNYVENHLLPRLNGFELLMASYAMAHLKLDLLLTETGYKPMLPSFGAVGGGQNARLRVYLTNSLEESHPDTGTLFANWLSTEANEANHIKRDTPVMCVIGNPPYSGISSNNGEWISKLIEDYKYVDGVHFNERKHWLNDDYVKFLRYGQHFIEKNGSGVLAFINPHGFLDNPTFRGMRWNLLKTYDKIYTIDLHGNSKKKETAPDGSIDQNVFDIMQGVSINIFVKTGKKKQKELGKVFHYNLLGKREFKYNFLIENSLSLIGFKEINSAEPNYFFVPKNIESLSEYKNGFLISELFISQSMGVTSARDSFVIDFEKRELESRISDFCDRKIENNPFQAKYMLNENYQWKVAEQREIVPEYSEKYIKPISYRPFDNRYIYFQDNLVFRMRGEIMSNFNKRNIAFCAVKLGRNADYHNYFLTDKITDKGISSSLDNANIFPLYLYPETYGQQTIEQTAERTPNLNMEIVQQIAEKLGLEFVAEKVECGGLTTPDPSKGGAQIVQNLKGDGERIVQNMYADGSKKPGYITANAESYRFVREFREELKKNPTEAENIIWEFLKSKKTGHKIRRQHVIDNFIADFVCLRKRTVIEIDGKIHLSQKEADEERTKRLNYLGFDVIRFTNEEVLESPATVAMKIQNNLDQKPDFQSIEDTFSPPLEENIPSFSPPSEGSGEVKAPVSPSKNLERSGVVKASVSSSKNLEGSGVVKAPVSPTTLKTFAPIDILDYIYAVLHSPTYREKYKEFLKIDFPRVPYPKDNDTFWQLVKLGGEIRQIHLLESPIVEKYITQYPIDGDNVVTKPRFSNSPPLEGCPQGGVVGKVYINETQYFDNVPEVAWNFYIGGYQPAQKWLKDRKERKLEFEDILHYQKIIVALTETDRIMKEIDMIEIE